MGIDEERIGQGLVAVQEIVAGDPIVGPAGRRATSACGRSVYATSATEAGDACGQNTHPFVCLATYIA
jgi:hypothetical protein